MEKSKKIYLDYASGVSPNPSSIHTLGVSSKSKLENARKIVANSLEARPLEIIFTSGGTESNNLAIQGIVGERTDLKNSKRSVLKETIPHIITTNIEHASVLETFKMLEKRKLAQMTIVPVEQNGIVDPKKIKKAIKKNTILISVMYANNEIGTIQPIKEIAKEIRHFKKMNRQDLLNFPFFHTDAVQAVNYLDINVEKLGVDLLSISGSKIEGAAPKDGQAGRVGVLYKRKNVPLAPIFYGGDQESGLRPGTEHLSEIIKFVQAFEFSQKIKEKENKRLTKLRDYFIEKLLSLNFKIKLNGNLGKRLPNNINITIPNIPSDLLVIELSARGVMASAKSACKSGDGKGSHVIKAIDNSIKETDGSLRFSFGRATSKADIDYTLRTLSKILTKLKRWYN